MFAFLLLLVVVAVVLVLVPTRFLDNVLGVDPSIHPSIPGEFELVAGEERTRMMEWNADIRIPQRRDALLSSPLLSPLTMNEWMNGCMNECMYVYIHPIHPADTYEQTRQASSSPSVLEKEEKGWAPISRSLALA